MKSSERLRPDEAGGGLMIYRFTDEIREEEMKYTCAEASKILRKLKFRFMLRVTGFVTDYLLRTVSV